MQRSEAIETEVRNWVAAAQAHDPGLYDAVSREHGALVIGAAPGQWSTDVAAMGEAYKAEVAKLPPSTMEVERLHAYEEGGVGWAAAEATWRIQGMAPLGTRLTFVFHRESGAWRPALVQTSVPVPDEELFG
jgi:ketosteroid isomerase-like protein